MKGNCAVIGNTLSLKGISYYCTELDMRLPTYRIWWQEGCLLSSGFHLKNPICAEPERIVKMLKLQAFR